MTLPDTIRAVVDPQAITRVTRLFNGTLADVLNELLQNARRAGATRVDVEMHHDGEQTTLIVRDDGRGIDDPTALLALGRSGWSAGIAASEDPAGMGVFSLAGRHVEVRSRAHGTPTGWRVVIRAHAWECGTPLPVEPCGLPHGTDVRIALPDAWTRNVAGEVKAAALYYPLPVSIDGAPCERRDFLDRAVAVEQIGCCRIGVFRNHLADEPRLNFHGLQLRCRLPIVGEVDDPLRWSARIDVIDAPGLKLVLPARKELVENDATTVLREAAEAAIYRTLGLQPAHRLPFTGWCRARDLGVVLPPADASLPVWAPATADDDVWRFPTMVRDEPMLIVPQLEPALAQAASRGLRSFFTDTARLVEAQRAFSGYSWYDELPRIDAVAVLIHVDGTVHGFDDDEDMPAGLFSGPVDNLQLDFTVIPGAGDNSAPVAGEDATEPHRHRLAIDALVFDPEGGGQVDEAIVLLRRGADIAPDRLADQIMDTLFHADDDAESDSAETQRDHFRRVARATAIGLLQGEEAAALDRIRCAFDDDIRWLIPAGRTITAGSTGLSVDWAPGPVAA